MQVIVNDEAYQPTGGPKMTVGDLATEVGMVIQGQPRIVVSLHCDGQLVEQADLQTVLARPATDFQTLELRTQPLSAMVRNILAETIDLFHQADQARERAGLSLVEGRTEEAMNHLQNFFVLWRQVQEAMIVSARALEVDLDSLNVGGKTLMAVLEAMRKPLNDLKDAMVNRDHVVVGDILQYEFAEPLTDWLQLLTILQQQAGPANA